MPQNSQTSIPKEELEVFSVLGKKLAYLLSISSLPTEAKEAWAALVPKMTFEQIERLAALLERDIAGQDPQFQVFADALKTAKEQQKSTATDEDPLRKFSDMKKAS